MKFLLELVLNVFKAKERKSIKVKEQDKKGEMHMFKYL